MMARLRPFSWGTLCLAIWVCLSATSTHAAPPKLIPGPVIAEIIKVYDGDTYTVDAYPMPRHTLRLHVRLRGIDTPEIRGRCQAEKDKAQAARHFAIETLGTIVRLMNIEDGKYAGRFIADVVTEAGKDMAKQLIMHGHGRPYAGGKRQGWCD